MDCGLTPERAAICASHSPRWTMWVAQTPEGGGCGGTVLISLERYQAASDAADELWSARQHTAMRLYLKRVAEAQRREADAFQKEAKKMPPDDPNTLAQLQAAQDALSERPRQGADITPDEPSRLKALGIAEDEAKAENARLLAFNKVCSSSIIFSAVRGFGLRSLQPRPARS
jgi:hypothetical protein